MLLLSKLFILVALILSLVVIVTSASLRAQEIEGYINPYHEVFTTDDYTSQASSAKKKNSNSNSNSNNDRRAETKPSTALTFPGSPEVLSNLPVARLRRFLTEREAQCDGCVDKRDLVDRAVEVMAWPTRDDSVANDLSLEQDLMGPLASDLTIPIGEDRGPFQDQFGDETVGQNPSARSSLAPLSDEEVVQLLELHRLRMLVADGVARCGPRMLNHTQYCGPAFAIVEKYAA